MSSQQTISQFFASKTFTIPKYQRSFAWEKQNVRELYDDVIEAVSTHSSHYIGTIILAKTEKPTVFGVVDGQQRLTSLILLISAVVNRLQDQQDRDYWRRYYVGMPNSYKLTPLERDKQFYFALLNSRSAGEPQSKSQRYLAEVYEEINNILNLEKISTTDLLNAIGQLNVLEFVEDNESDAIRIFQTVNDRGKELSRMDKMKSLLFYFSDKYCGGQYDNEINDKFGQIFELYDDIKLIGEANKINIINSKQFNEDDLLRHHYVCFSEESYDPTGQQVFDNVKLALFKFRTNRQFNLLSAYIAKYLTSLVEYVAAFRNILERVNKDTAYFKLFSILGLSAAYYPVVTMLEKYEFLDRSLKRKNVSILNMIEIIDVRVLKVRGYAGRKYIAEFAFRLGQGTVKLKDVEHHLLWFNSFQIDNNRFKDYIANNDLYLQSGLLRTLFIDYCERLRKTPYSLSQLQEIMSNDPTIEHVLSITPKFKPKAYGFRDEEDFGVHKNLIGNLTLLEKKLNSAVQNSGLSEKIAGYRKSKFKVTSELATALTNSDFKKENLLERSKRLAEDFAERWWA